MGIRKASVIAALCAILAAAGGCGVSKATHQAVAEELQTCEGERDQYAAKRSELARRVEELETRLEAERSATQEELESLRKQQAELDRQLEEFQSLTEKFKEMIAADGIQVYVRRGRMIVALPSGVLFPSGSAELSGRGLETLEAVAGKLKDLDDRRFLVAGHTDNVPISNADFEDNWHLSTARALRVTRVLVEHGIPPKNLAPAGYGEHDPVRSNRSKDGRRLNRRIELIIEPRIPDMSKLPELRTEGDRQDGGAAGQKAGQKASQPKAPQRAAGNKK